MPRAFQVQIVPRAGLDPAVLAAQSDLGRRSWDASAEPDARYPRGMLWTPPTWLVLVWTADRGRLVGRAGVVERAVRWGERRVRVGGVSSVSTDPEFWGQGVASLAMRTLAGFMHAALDVTCGLLLASRMGAPVYARLGWRVVEGPVRCAQPHGPMVWTDVFPDKPAMALPRGAATLPEGPIDLDGLPW